MSQGQQVYQEPSEVTTLSLPPSPLPPSLGGVVDGPPLAWTVCGEAVHSFDTRTGRRVSTWRCAGFTVTTTCQFRCSSSKTYLVVVLESSSQCLLGLLSLETGRLSRLLSVPHRVSSVCSVSPSNLPSPGLFAQTLLTVFRGVVALGCVGGHVLLVDLALGAEELTPRDLSEPRRLHCVDLALGPALAEVGRAAESGKHACVELTAKCYEGGEGFAFFSKDGSILKTFSSSSVAVTAVTFVPHIATLLVGFNFGSFQMYSLSSLSLLHSTPASLPLPPVTHFTFLEPADDPRCFVYVWVARGGTPFIKESLRCESKLALYQLVFARKTTGGVLPFYHAFQGCGPRLEYHMTATPSLPHPRISVGSRLVRCFTVQRHRKGCGLDESHDGHSGEDLSLAVFVWQCAEPSSEEGEGGGGGGGGGGAVMAALFDINQWYHAQMPSSVKWRPSAGKRMGVFSCPYFAFFSLSPAMGGASSLLLGAAVSGVTPLLGLPPVPETHSWPLALSFQVAILTEDALKTCKFLGLQRTALQRLQRGARLLYAEPQRLYQLCEAADLLPPSSSWESDSMDTNSQRKALLTVALEWDLVPVLMSFQEAWLACGAGEPVLSDWLRSTLSDVSRDRQQLCQPLFSGHAPSEATPTLGYFHRLCVRVRVLAHLLQRSLTAVSMETTSHKVEQELNALCCEAVDQYKMLEVCMWCVDNALLPVSNDPYSEHCFSYPAAVLTRQFERLRSVDNQLCVDYFCNDLEIEGGFPYPATTLEDLLSVIASPNPMAPHCLMMYFLKDIMSLDEENTQYHKLLESYCRLQCLPNHLASFVLGAWHLDHRNYKEAVRLFLSLQSSWFPWQHRVVVSALLRGGVASLAWDYIIICGAEMEQTEEEVRLKLGAAAAAGHLLDAQRLLRVFEASNSYMELLTHFLECCYHAKCLHLFFDLSLNTFEEDGLCAYLEASRSLVCQELLVGFLLTRHRYLEAKALHDKIAPLVRAETDSGVRERAEQRDAILSGFTPAVPAVLRSVVPLTFSSQPGTELSFDPTKPLSAIVAKQLSSGAVKSQTGLIYSALERIAKARSAATESLTPFRAREGSRLAELSHAPFLSTPLSVRKLKRRTTLLQPTPLHRSHPHTPSTTLTPGGRGQPEVSSFMSEMRSFKSRMATLMTQSSSVLESTAIHTPLLAQTPVLAGRGSVLRRSAITPPSILKVRSQAPPLVLPAGADPAPRKIRFAVEKSSPAPPPPPPATRETGKSKPSFTPAHPSPLTTLTPAHPSPVSIAAVTPLPLSDDSDLFLSPAESPSQLHSPPSQPSPPSPPSQTSLRLFDASPKSGAHSDMELGQQPSESDDGMGTEEEQDGMGTEEQNGMGTQHRELDQSEEAVEGGETHRSVSMATVQPIRLKVHPREAISFVARPRSPATQTPRPPSLFTPASSQPLGSSSPLLSAARASPKPRPSPGGVFSPLAMSELLEAKKQQLHRSFQASMRRELSALHSGTDASAAKATRVSVVKQQVSATMVTSPVAMDATPRRELTHASPSFVFSQPIPSPVTTETLSSEMVETPEEQVATTSFVFSPPLTRSAARRRKEKGEGPWMSDTPSLEAGAVAAAKKQGRSRKSMKIAALKSEDPVSLVTPPTTPLVVPGNQQPRPKPVRTAVGTRRSSRLLEGGRK